jgi:hypothetical protein
MASHRQVEANRRNALMSSGPKTETGKRRSLRNAVRHGLTAETVIEVLEDPEDCNWQLPTQHHRFSRLRCGSPGECKIPASQDHATHDTNAEDVEPALRKIKKIRVHQ